jgi:hypothetical protein
MLPHCGPFQCISVHGCNRTIHTSSCYRHVTTNVCTKPRIINSTQPMRKSLSKLTKSLNIDVLYPGSQSLPQTSTTVLAGGATKSNQCGHLERISIQIDLRLVRAEPALPRFSASECGLVKQLQNTKRRGWRHPGANPHNPTCDILSWHGQTLTMQVRVFPPLFVPILAVASRSVCLSLFVSSILFCTSHLFLPRTGLLFPFNVTPYSSSLPTARPLQS